MGGETQRKRGEGGGRRERLRERDSERGEGDVVFTFYRNVGRAPSFRMNSKGFLTSHLQSLVWRRGWGQEGAREGGERKLNEQDGRIPNATMFALHVTTLRQRTALDESGS